MALWNFAGDAYTNSNSTRKKVKRVETNVDKTKRQTNTCAADRVGIVLSQVWIHPQHTCTLERLDSLTQFQTFVYCKLWSIRFWETGQLLWSLRLRCLECTVKMKTRRGRCFWTTTNAFLTSQDQEQRKTKNYSVVLSPFLQYRAQVVQGSVWFDPWQPPMGIKSKMDSEKPKISLHQSTFTEDLF